MTTTALIISVYKGARELKAVLEALIPQSKWLHEILVSEDGDDERMLAVVNEARSSISCSLVHVRQKDDGRRKCMILNKTIIASSADYCIFIDGDCIPHPKFIEDHIRLAQDGHYVQGRRAFIEEDAVGEFLNGETLLSLFFKRKLTGIFKGVRLPFAHITIDQAERGIIGCNYAMWKKHLLAINGFDQHYDGGWGREDSDAVFRLYHLGIKRKLVYWNAIVYHLNHPVHSRHDLDERDAYYAAVKQSKRITCDQGIQQLLEKNDLGELIR